MSANGYVCRSAKWGLKWGPAANSVEHEIPVVFWISFVLIGVVFLGGKMTGLLDWAIFFGGILVLFLVPQVIVEFYLRIAKKNSS